MKILYKYKIQVGQPILELINARASYTSCVGHAQHVRRINRWTKKVNYPFSLFLKLAVNTNQNSHVQAGKKQSEFWQCHVPFKIHSSFSCCVWILKVYNHLSKPCNFVYWYKWQIWNWKFLDQVVSNQYMVITFAYWASRVWLYFKIVLTLLCCVQLSLFWWLTRRRTPCNDADVVGIVDVIHITEYNL